jgi:methionyl-tRNA formyltransferase
MRGVFLGTPTAAIPSLAAMAGVVDVTAVVTRPDRPKGRGDRPSPSPVKLAALDWGFPVEQPQSDAGLLEVLETHKPDFALVVAYGRILRSEALEVVPMGFVNVHFSLLPRWRGAAPVERALLAGDDHTGVTLMLIDAGLDTGPILSVAETPITGDETGGSLTARLSYIGGELVDEALPSFLTGRLSAAPQLATGVLAAPPLTRQEAQIDGTWDQSSAERAVRAYNPRPGAWIEVDGGDQLKVVSASVHEAGIEPGRIEGVGGVPVLGLADGSLQLDELQPPGRRRQSGKAWLNGRRGEAIEVIGRE